MKQAVKIPPKPTRTEQQQLDKYFILQDWEFEVMIEDNCTQVSSQCIHFEKNESGNWDKQCAVIFGKRAMFAETKKPCLSNFFIRYSWRVYQTNNITEATAIIALLKKEHEYGEYGEKLLDEKFKQRELEKAAKEKQKAKVKKLMSTHKAKAA